MDQVETWRPVKYDGNILIFLCMPKHPVCMFLICLRLNAMLSIRLPAYASIMEMNNDQSRDVDSQLICS